MNQPTAPSLRRLTQLEFFVAMRALGRDRMPYPLELATDVDTETEFRRDCEAAAAALAGRVKTDLGLYRALNALAWPQVRVEVFGYSHQGCVRQIRIHAAIGSSIDAVALQDPGPGPGTTGDVVVFPHVGAATVKRLVSLLPQFQAGTPVSICMSRQDLEPPAWEPVSAGGLRREATRFLDRPYRSYFEIVVDSGVALDGWRPTGCLQVVDFVDAGGYQVSLGQRIDAAPLASDDLYGLLRARIEDLVAPDQG